MTIESPKYDVAISFLSRDEATAAAIHQKLSEGLQVFFYPGKQEELAGTDGLESMRKPFFDDSRVMVVLYREGWGKTPWTRIEETAITDGCLKHGWQRLLFIVLDSASALPVWLPTTHVRFNFTEFGLEQAVGAIKARVIENGGQNQPLTPTKRAEMFQAEELFRRDKARMNSEDGLNNIVSNVGQLFEEVEKHCAEINAAQSLKLRCASEFIERSAIQTCVITDGHVGLTVVWHQPYSNTLDKSALVIREYNRGLILPGETHLMHLTPPSLLRETKYSPELSLARQYGWREDDVTGFISSAALAEKCVIQFVDLASRYARGEIRKAGFPA